MKKCAVVFDLDGTLLNTLQDLAESGNMLRDEYGLPGFPVADYAFFVGNGIKDLIKQIMPNAKNEALGDLVEQFAEIYQRNWQRNCCPYPGIDDMLAGLVEVGMPLAVLSNKPHKFTPPFVNHYFGNDLFSVVYGQRVGVPKKPDPQGVLQVLAELDCEAKDSFFVGDSKVDMQTGTAAGMCCVGVSWGFRGSDELRSSGADIIIDSPMQLIDYVSTLT